MLSRAFVMNLFRSYATASFMSLSGDDSHDLDQLNLDGCEDRIYRKYWDRYPHFIEPEP